MNFKWKWVKNEWAKAGPDNWLIWGNKTGYGWVDKVSHCFGHFTAVMLGSYLYGLPLWLLIPGSILFGVAYEYFWDNLAEGSGASKLDIIANSIGMFSAVLCILIKSLMDSYPLFYKLSPYILLVGFVVTFAYKVWKLRKK